jgi:hypothetical protein
MSSSFPSLLWFNSARDHFVDFAHTYDRLVEAAVAAKGTQARCPAEGYRARLPRLCLLIDCQSSSLCFFAVVFGVLVSFSVHGVNRLGRRRGGDGGE